MVLSKSFISITALTCWQVCQASPLQARPDYSSLSKRLVENANVTTHLTSKGVNCFIAQDPDCWAVMEMPKFIKDWLAGPSGSLCGTQGFPEGFGDCFISVYRGTPLCSTISEANCGTGIEGIVSKLTTSDLHGDEDHPAPMGDLERRQIFFCLYNIAAIEAWFHNWYTASGTAAARTANKITDIVNVAAPPPKAETSIWKSLAIDALLSGLAFLPGIGEGTSMLSSTAAAVRRAESPVRAVLAASGSVYGQIFPHDGSAASDLIAMGTLSTALEDFTDDLTLRLEPALQTALNSVDDFLKMTDTGVFSSAKASSLIQDTDNLEQALTTYIVSTALSGATWNVVVSPQTNVDSLLSGGQGKLNIDWGCQGTADATTGFCNIVWNDRANTQGFTLVQADSFLNNPHDAFENFFGSTKHDAYTTPELLFLGAAKCRLRPGWGTGVGVQMIDGEMNFDCLSQMKVCTYKADCQEKDEGSCEYKEEDCPADKGYGYDRDRYRGMPDEEAEAANSFFVPPGYMGPFINGDLHYDLRWTSP
ncbi:MAG: hypothetical protein L6R37_000624 [Teloschistes peruensis]|nr:MAG: hypothetical protein L6R37_000624 [Teloschistes peruensis]